MKDDQIVGFYEGKFTSSYYDKREKNLFSKLRFRSGISKKRLRFIEKYTKKGLILDIGCGGNKILMKKGQCIGVDISTSSLKIAKKIYSYVVKASINRLPFRDEIFDSVVSLDVLRYIPVKEKDSVVFEIKRVLKEEGISIHFVETKSRDHITKKAEEYKELFYRYFIQLDGHFGLETPEELKCRFNKHFKKVIIKHGFSIIVPFDEFSKRYDNEYKQKNLIFISLVFFDNVLGGRYIRRLGEIINFVSDIALMRVLNLYELIFPLSLNGGVFVILKSRRD